MVNFSMFIFSLNSFSIASIKIVRLATDGTLTYTGATSITPGWGLKTECKYTFS